MTPRRALLVVSVSCLLWLLWLAPASLILLALPKAGANNGESKLLPVSVSGLQGHVWRGKADSLLVAVNDELALSAQLRWRFDAASLTDGQFCLAIGVEGTKHTDLRAEGRVCVSPFSGIHMPNMDVEVPAGMLLQGGDVRPGGRVVAQLQGHWLNGWWQQLQGRGVWLDAKLHVKGQGEGIDLQQIPFCIVQQDTAGPVLLTAGNTEVEVSAPLDLEVAVDSRFFAERRYQSDIVVHTTPYAPSIVQQWLPVFADEYQAADYAGSDAIRHWQLNWQGQW